MMKRNDLYRKRHEAQRFVVDADRAEFQALKNGAAEIDSGVYGDRVAGTLEDSDFIPPWHEESQVDVTRLQPAIDEVARPHDAERWHGEDLKNDTAVGGTRDEIERRIRILRDAYPFRLEGGTLSHLIGVSSIYEFFLSICNATTLTSGSHVRLPRLFERIAARLVAAYFGQHATSIHTGAPRGPDTDSSFMRAMKNVETQTREWAWGPDVGLSGEQHQGDEGCDFIVWLMASDRRKIGQLFVLGQCACGNDWQSKYGDLDLKRLQKWFNPLSVVDPVRSFATPHHVTDPVLREASRHGGLFFDRARLTMTAHGADGDVIGDEMKENMESLIDLVLRGR